MARLMFFFFEILLIFNYLNSVSSLEAEQMVNSLAAPPGSFKFTCALVRYRTVVCTCFILGNKWIGTAGHCIISDLTKGVTNFPLKIAANFDDLNYMASALQPYVHKIHSHKDFKKEFHLAHLDVALMELREYLNIESHGIIPLKIPQKNDPLYTKIINQKVVMAGFGYEISKFVPNYNTRTMDHVLQRVHKKKMFAQIEIIADNPQCCQSDALMCSILQWQDNALVSGPCQGDSGAVIEANGYALLVYSFSEFVDNTRSQQRAVFVKVGHHADWINDVMNGIPNPNVATHETMNQVFEEKDYDPSNDHKIFRRSITNGSNQNSSSNKHNKPLSSVSASKPDTAPKSNTTPKPHTTPKPITTPKPNITPHTPTTPKHIVTSKPNQPSVQTPTHKPGVHHSSLQNGQTLQPVTASPGFQKSLSDLLVKRDGDSCYPKPASTICSSSGMKAPLSGVNAPSSGMRAPSSGASVPSSGASVPSSGASVPSSGASVPSSGASIPPGGASVPKKIRLS